MYQNCDPADTISKASNDLIWSQNIQELVHSKANAMKTFKTDWSLEKASMMNGVILI